MHHYLAEESSFHEKALQAVRSVASSGEVAEIIASLLRGYLLLENSSLTGSEQVLLLGVAGKSMTTQPSAVPRGNLGQR